LKAHGEAVDAVDVPKFYSYHELLIVESAMEANMMTMHPGEYLFLSYVEPLKISGDELAERTGLPIAVVNGLISGELDLTAEMAVRLELAFDRSAESWMGLQTDHSLAKAKKMVDPATVRPFVLSPRADAA
jgi:addiction module HigA family antidote